MRRQKLERNASSTKKAYLARNNSQCRVLTPSASARLSKFSTVIRPAKVSKPLRSFTDTQPFGALKMNERSNFWRAVLGVGSAVAVCGAGYYISTRTDLFRKKEVAFDLSTNTAKAEFVSESPLLANCGFSKEDVLANETNWLAVGEMILRHLNFDQTTMTRAQQSRIYQYYLPVSMWIDNLLRSHQKNCKLSGNASPLVVGISAPQGCGKSTIVECLQFVFQERGFGVGSISIDDFYLTRKEQVAVSESNPGNSILEVRGNAGTHDLQLGTETLSKLQGLVAPTSSVSVPRYNKAAHGGKGDRADKSAWPELKGPVDLVLFEGWMLGFRPLDTFRVSAVNPDLIPVNQALEDYKEAWDKFVDAWLVVKVQDPEVVFKWRLEAEHAMINNGKSGMSDDEVRAFCSRYMPAYKAYLPGLYSKGPTTLQSGKGLLIELGSDRSPLDTQPTGFGV